MCIVILMKVTCMDRELNSTPFSSSRIFNLALFCSIIGLPVSYISSHFRFNETVKSDSIVTTCYELIVSTCEIYWASIHSIVYKQLIIAYFRYFYNEYGVGTGVILDFYYYYSFSVDGALHRAL